MSNLKEINIEELKQHKTREDIWFAIHGKVYNVTQFLEEHPGGEEILLERAGSDATAAFEDIGHSMHAREQMKKYMIGALQKKNNSNEPTLITSPMKPYELVTFLAKILIPFMALALVILTVNNR